MNGLTATAESAISGVYLGEIGQFASVRVKSWQYSGPPGAEHV